MGRPDESVPAHPLRGQAAMEERPSGRPHRHLRLGELHLPPFRTGVEALRPHEPHGIGGD